METNQEEKFMSILFMVLFSLFLSFTAFIIIGLTTYKPVQPNDNEAPISQEEYEAINLIDVDRNSEESHPVCHVIPQLRQFVIEINNRQIEL